jgi:hypothetical protein
MTPIDVIAVARTRSARCEAMPTGAVLFSVGEPGFGSLHRYNGVNGGCAPA